MNTTKYGSSLREYRLGLKSLPNLLDFAELRAIWPVTARLKKSYLLVKTPWLGA